jgi:predicted ribosomally synthesized peptide with SipW-like signal peptide
VNVSGRNTGSDENDPEERKGGMRVRKYMLFILAAMLAIAVICLGTFAWFSDTETESATLTCGSIDISTNKTVEYNVDDLKPCDDYAAEIQVEVVNTGGNPVVVWKHLKDFVNVDGADPADPSPGDLAAVIDYDLSVDGSVIFTYDNELTLRDVECMWMPIGELEPGEKLTVSQSYHLQEEVGNWAQCDSLSFTMEFYGEQKKGNGPTQAARKLFLDNKETTDWYFMVDGVWGILDWTAGPGELYAQGLTPGEDYSLTTYVDPWPGSPATEIAAGTADVDGKLMISGITMPSGYTGKIWLVLSNDLDTVANEMVGYNPGSYLFEGNKVSIP